MRRRTGCVAWFLVIVFVVALFLTWQYFDYLSASRTLPAGMTVAGMPVEGMTREQVLNVLEVGFATPVELAYQEQRLSLPPDSIELRYDAEETEVNLDAVLAARGGINGFMAHLLRRPLDPVDVPVAVSYSAERLDGFLSRVARQYDRPPQDPVPLPASLTFRVGQPGSELDVEASRARLSAALISPTDRQVELVVQTEEAQPLDIKVLGQLLQSLLDDHENLIPGIFVKGLQTGDELGINAGVAYAGLGVLKIAILEETYRVLDYSPDVEMTMLLSDTITLDENVAANSLLRDAIGDGDGQQGADNLTDSMLRLGLVNTFMAAPYDGGEEVIPPTIVTPANSRTDVVTDPDPFMQTTPLDVGLLLEMIYQCSHDGGALMVAYPGAFTADECGQMIEWMSMNRIDSLIEAGIPVGTSMAHKHGLTGDTHADAALVFSPGGDFVLIIFLYRPEWLDWEESASLMASIATATYNYFNPSQ
ncbi:MAG: serine hydrolase [Chloroflexota bacterium]|nr:serine hydrolase [Chloroflexota bacterium]